MSLRMWVMSLSHVSHVWFFVYVHIHKRYETVCVVCLCVWYVYVLTKHRLTTHINQTCHTCVCRMDESSLCVACHLMQHIDIYVLCRMVCVFSALMCTYHLLLKAQTRYNSTTYTIRVVWCMSLSGFSSVPSVVSGMCTSRHWTHRLCVHDYDMSHMCVSYGWVMFMCCTYQIYVSRVLCNT